MSMFFISNLHASVLRKQRGREVAATEAAYISSYQEKGVTEIYISSFPSLALLFL